MPVPASITYITVTGHYVDASGTALSGTVEFTPLFTRLADSADGTLISPNPVRASLDGSGDFTASLMISDDDDVSPSGWSYQVDTNLVSGSARIVDSYAIDVTDGMSSPQSLADLAPGLATTVAGGLVRPVLLASQLTSFSAVTNTTSETDVAKLTIPAGATGSGSVLVFEAGGFLQNTSGGSISHALKLKLGSTAMVTSPSLTVANNSNNLKWHFRANLLFTSAAAQRATVQMAQAAASASNWGPAGDITVGFGTATEAMSAATDLALRVTPGSASASYVMQALWATLIRQA